MQGSGSKQDELGMPICPCKVYYGDQNWRNAASFVQQYLKENEERCLVLPLLNATKIQQGLGNHSCSFRGKQKSIHE
jgi:hypothetical protein